MPSIGVLEAHQKVSEKPTRRIKRSGGQSYVNQGKAEWVIRNVLLRMLAVATKKFPPIPYRQPRYIPDRLPSHRVPGTKTVGPVAEQDAKCRAHMVVARIIALQGRWSVAR